MMREQIREMCYISILIEFSFLDIVDPMILFTNEIPRDFQIRLFVQDVRTPECINQMLDILIVF